MGFQIKKPSDLQGEEIDLLFNNSILSRRLWGSIFKILEENVSQNLYLDKLTFKYTYIINETVNVQDRSI